MTLLLALALLIGIRHAFEPDHIAAVLTVSAQSKSLSATAKQGAIWGIGHTITLFTFSLLLIGIQVEINERIYVSFDFLIGCLLVLMGLDVLKKTKTIISNQTGDNIEIPRTLNNKTFLSLKALGIGLLHGAAGSGVIIAIVTTTIDSIYLKFTYITLFSIGLIICMSLFSMLMGIPLQRRVSMLPTRYFKIIAGSAAIVIGLRMLYTSSQQINSLFI